MTEQQAGLEKEVKAKLAALGTSARAVAKNLRALGIKGEMEEPSSCPLANYLTKDDPNGMAEVCNDEITVWSGAVWVTFDTPGHLSTFVENFDKGQYPGLVRESE